MAVHSHYESLDVARDATAAEIKAAYRRSAKQWHPDRNPHPEAAARFRELEEAYRILSRSDGRARYDAELAWLEAQERAREARRQQEAESVRAKARLAQCQRALEVTPQRLVAAFDWIDRWLRRLRDDYPSEPSR